MAKRDKRVEAMRRNPRQVRFATLQRVLEDHGFVGRRPGGSHWTYQHPGYPPHVTIVERRPFVLIAYVLEALKAIEAVSEGEEE
ncbi:MAG: hypothetical protein GEU73_04050 [Chloroflexi bacterium]|nr:hypothetical protein [Chloroflexota bacterium]